MIKEKVRRRGTQTALKSNMKDPCSDGNVSVSTSCLWDKTAKDTLDLSIVFLSTACEPTIISKVCAF